MEELLRENDIENSAEGTQMYTRKYVRTNNQVQMPKRSIFDSLHFLPALISTRLIKIHKRRKTNTQFPKLRVLGKNNRSLFLWKAREPNQKKLKNVTWEKEDQLERKFIKI